MRDLYWGDNLTVLRNHIDDESIDLIYLDPPFNSSRNYNVLFREDDWHESDAQIAAFDDTWQWGESSEETYNELVHGNDVPQKVSGLIVAMRSFIGSNDVMAYLVMMTVRLLELHRVLKPTGSIYLHCDHTASHYLKVVMDTIWGPKNFRNEITWKRTSAHPNVGQRFAWVQDRLLHFSRSEQWIWNPQFVPYTEKYINSHYGQVEPETGRRFTTRDLTASMQRASRGQLYEWKGIRPPPSRCWAYTKEKMEEFEASDRLVYSPRGMPRMKLYLDEMPGTPLDDVWTDIPPINSQAAERLGYPTQKPEALLERIIKASSNEGDMVLDPFCGCGTAIAVAERLNRQWIGIDVTHLAISLIVSRMESAFPGIEINRYGEPADIGGAKALAELDRFDFQNWALSLVSARPAGVDKAGRPKRGADQGIDGTISFLGATNRKPGKCIVQVKSGHVNRATVGELVGTVEREKAEMGLLITLEEPTRPMTVEALEGGYYHSELMGRDYPKIQILTIRELLDGAQPRLPLLYNPYRLAPQQQRNAGKQMGFENVG